ncbi:unnamed protein product [Mytilus edulis]|uniref:Uncharacterized protein n=1 Tax=Mytilus edulis TaxID=6550 RepID=A0A8S3VBX6_MYTED|nr:unnamed protein product [Mytilus edulis]
MSDKNAYRYTYAMGIGNSSTQYDLVYAKEILSTDERTAYRALQAEKEVRRYVRIQVIGKDGVGKTCLVRRLLGKPINDVTSTDGIEINRTCQIRTSDGEWIISGEENKGTHKRDQSQDNLLPKEKNEHKTFPNDEPNQQTIIAETLGTNVTATKNDIEPLTKYKNEYSSGLNDSRDNNKSIIPETGDSEVIESIQTAKNQNHLNVDKADEVTKAMKENMGNILLNAKKNKGTNTLDTSDDLIDCGIWDFAGHKAYHATNQTFLTPDAIYLLVVDITDDIKPMEYDGMFDISSCGGYIDFWIDSVQCFCEASEYSSASASHPSIVIVCTGIDKIPEEEKEPFLNNTLHTFTPMIFSVRINICYWYRPATGYLSLTQFHRIEKKYVQYCIDTFRCQNKGSNIRDRIHFISNTESPPDGFEYLRKQISEIAKERKYFAENLPTQWIQLESALTFLKDLKEKEKDSICSYEVCTVEKQYGEVHPAIYAGKAVMYLEQKEIQIVYLLLKECNMPTVMEMGHCRG